MAQLLLANPKKPAKKRRSPSRALPRKVGRRRLRRNPLPVTGMVGQVMDGVVGAGGALAVDVIISKLPLPAELQVGPMAAATRAAVGIGLGMVVAKIGKNKKLGTQLAGGALTVGLYGTLKSAIGPSIGLAGTDLLGTDLLGMGYSDWRDDLGYLNPAPVYNAPPGHGFYQSTEFDTNTDF